MTRDQAKRHHKIFNFREQLGLLQWFASFYLTGQPFLANK
jgi:hypothetical protein